MLFGVQLPGPAIQLGGGEAQCGECNARKDNEHKALMKQIKRLLNQKSKKTVKRIKTNKSRMTKGTKKPERKDRDKNMRAETF